MTFKIGDRVRLAPHVTDEMLESILIEDEEIAIVRSGLTVEDVGGSDTFGDDERVCDVHIGGFYVPSEWLVLAEPDVETMTRILAELRAPAPRCQHAIDMGSCCRPVCGGPGAPMPCVDTHTCGTWSDGEPVFARRSPERVPQ